MSDAEMREKVIDGLEHCIKNDCSEDCPYTDAEWIKLGLAACRDFSEDTVEVPERMLYDALVILKAQEPHVLTLEEACGWDYCFYEYRATGYVEPASVVLSGMLLNGTLPLVEVYRLGREGAALVAANGYGHEWRCWDRMPEDGQKEATPWQ